MVLQTISLTNLDTTPPEKMAGTSGFEPEHAGVKVLCLTGLATSQYIIYGGQSRIWTCKSFPTNGFQDCFLTIRTYGIFWCVPRDSNPYSQKRTAPSRQRVYQIPPGTHIVFRYRRQTVNYSTTSYRASCFTHYCIGRDVTQLNVLRNVHRRISLGYSIPTVYVLFMLLH